MGKRYNIVDRLRSRNEKSVVTVDDEHEYPIDTSKTNVLGIMSIVKKNEKKEDDPEASIKLIDDIIRLALGEKAIEYINSLDMTMAAINDIVAVIMAAINEKEVDFDEEETEEKK